MLSIPHIIVIFVIVLVVFGPQKLPELARGLGKLMAEFRKASTDFRSAFEDEMRDLDRQAREAEVRKQQTASAPAELSTSEPGAAESGSGEPPALQESAPISGDAGESVPRTSETASEPGASAPPAEETLHDQRHPI